MKKKEQKKSCFEINVDKIVIYIILSGLAIYFGYRHFENKKLISNNKIATGYVFDHGLRCTTFYYFYVNSAEFTGSTYGNGLKIGDTLQIRYYPPNPSLNFCEKDFQALK